MHTYLVALATRENPCEIWQFQEKNVSLHSKS